MTRQLTASPTDQPPRPSLPLPRLLKHLRPSTGKAHCCVEFPGLRLLLTRHCKCALEILLRFRSVRLRRLKRDFAGDAIDLGLAPPFLGCLYRRHRFANAVRGIIELAEFRVGSRQI